jgi:hypothetical protein
MTLDELKAQRRWLLWRYVQRPGKPEPTKEPFTPNGSHAKSNDPATWRTYAECMAVISRFSGVGIVTGNGIGSTDLDDVIVDGKIIPEAMEIVTALNSYTETSPSGTGLLILTCSTLPGPGIGFVNRAFTGEIRDACFFHTFTGKHLDRTPLEVMPRQAEIEALYNRFRTPVKSVGDGIARPQAVEKFVRRFTAYAEGLGATITAIKTAGTKTLILTSPCLLHDDHDGGVGITADGIRCVQCFHTRCAVGWAKWSRLVEEKYGELMRLDGEIRWKK